MPGAIDTHAELIKIKNTRTRLKRRLSHYNAGKFAGELAAGVRDQEVFFASQKEKVLLATLFAEAGYFRRAARIVKSVQKSALEQYRTPGLLLALSEIDSDLVADYPRDVENARKFLQGVGAFQRLISENKDSIAIVGNAPNLLGKNLGAEIDKRRIVIRFNDFSQAPEVVDHCGRKIDIWVRSPTHLRVWRREYRPQELMMFGRPIFWRAKNAVDVLADLEMNGRTADEMPTRLYAELKAKLGASPSSGMAILYLVRHCIGSLKDVFVVGFDPAGQLAGIKKYFQHNEPHTTPPHDWAAEAKLLAELLSDAGKN